MYLRCEIEQKLETSKLKPDNIEICCSALCDREVKSDENLSNLPENIYR